MSRARLLAASIVGYLARADRLATDLGLLRLQIAPPEPCGCERSRSPSAAARVLATIVQDGSTYEIEVRVREGAR
jgi:hypothetical protein